MEWKCPICGKEYPNFGLKDFAITPKTTLFGEFKTRDREGNIQITHENYISLYVPKNVNEKMKINTL